MIDNISIDLQNGLSLRVRESDEANPIGAVIDVYKDDEYADTTFTINYDDYGLAPKKRKKMTYEEKCKRYNWNPKDDKHV